MSFATRFGAWHGFVNYACIHTSQPVSRCPALSGSKVQRRQQLALTMSVHVTVGAAPSRDYP
jgi:hypothetical protein